MSCLVRPKTDVKTLFAMTTSPAMVISDQLGAPNVPKKDDAISQVDNYIARIAKYVPAEVISFYLAADTMFAQEKVTTPGGSQAAYMNHAGQFIDAHASIFSWIIFLGAIIATPLYYFKQAEKGQPWSVHAAMSTIAFVIWSYAMNGSVYMTIYDPRIASVLICLFTLVSGLIVPGQTASKTP